ncbi:hypothetical protein [Parerythrobacter jejuensis]|uniref:Uncharacterized protein n=1 Tax=Parerythrobacter jejuensis TaxID=795812 RepID=A0A845APD0_9SPHN|nr:hypothetical protein [Parerythrobacter jejuensis]MXP31464.1 hypothetical protein [Parerythrobacter jejuensis]
MLANPVRRARARRWNHDRGWKYVGRTEENVALEEWPVDLWAEPWVRVGNQVSLRHPGDAQPLLVDCFFSTYDGRRHPFAALQLADETFIFFVPL